MRTLRLLCISLAVLALAGTGMAAANKGPLKPGQVFGPPAGSARVARIHELAADKQVVLTISAQIDGSSTLTINGRNAFWTHSTQAAPGRHEGADEPTIIGKKSWVPEWPDAGENRDCGCKSSVFRGITPPLPKTGPITFAAVSCREACDGTAGNGSAVINFDDDAIASDSTYTVTLTYAVPKKMVKVSGNVIRRVCDNSGGKRCESLKVVPVDGQQVSLTGKHQSYEAVTHGGEYEFRVRRGRYAIHLLGTKARVDPGARNVNAQDDVSGQDFTLCKTPENYKGPNPSCDLIEIDGTAENFKGEPASGPEITSDSDTTEIKDGKFTLYANPGTVELKEYRLERAKHPGDFEKFTVDADDDVVHASLKLLPQLEYDVAHTRKKRVDAEAWNLPHEFPAAFNFQVRGLHRTTPDMFECFLEGHGITDRLATDSINEAGAFAFPPYLEDTESKPTLGSFCEAKSYVGVLSDQKGTVLARKLMPHGLFE